MSNWICIRFSENLLWTADLFEGYEVIKNIGGSYPNISQVIYDARLSWGNNLNVKIFPAGYTANIRNNGEI